MINKVRLLTNRLAGKTVMVFGKQKTLTGLTSDEETYIHYQEVMLNEPCIEFHMNVKPGYDITVQADKIILENVNNLNSEDLSVKFVEELCRVVVFIKGASETVLETI